MRKDLGEGQKEENEPGSEGEPKPGDDPKNPGDEPDGNTDPADPKAGEASRSNQPAWMAKLPAQLRDAIVRGDYESVPPQYRPQVVRYIRWLQMQEPKER